MSERESNEERELRFDLAARRDGRQYSGLTSDDEITMESRLRQHRGDLRPAD